MDTYSTYTIITSSWLAIQAFPLLTVPSILLPLLTPEEHHASGLDTYLARSLAVSLLTLSGVNFLLSGLVPLNALRAVPAEVALAYASPLSFISTLFHGVSAVLCYMTWVNTSQTAYLLGLIGYGFCGTFGVWCSLFAEDSRISKRTGKDKRTSSLLFKDKKGKAEVLKEN